MDSSVLSIKVLTSLGRRRPCTKLLVTRPPSPFSYARTLALAGRGIPSSSKVGCHDGAGREEDATFVSTGVGGSWITIPLDDWGGEFGFEHHPGWWRSVLQPLVFYEFVQKKEGVKGEQGEFGHIPKVTVTTRSDARKE